MKSAIFSLITLVSLSAFASDDNRMTESQFSAVNGMQACIDYTKSLANEGLCRHLRSEPLVTVACNQTTRTVRQERLCLQGQVAPETAQACQENSFSRSEQVQCLKQASN
ncbi:MAG: hypothetical protein H7222_18255 [Methylotenera sp.]|nr:hypothetical protein [Oligoflexia bacterium]